MIKKKNTRIKCVTWTFRLSHMFDTVCTWLTPIHNRLQRRILNWDWDWLCFVCLNYVVSIEPLKKSLSSDKFINGIENEKHAKKHVKQKRNWNVFFFICIIIFFRRFFFYFKLWLHNTFSTSYKNKNRQCGQQNIHFNIYIRCVFSGRTWAWMEIHNIMASLRFG